MVTDVEATDAWLRWEGRYWRWSFAGYQLTKTLPPIELHLITPASILAMLAQGYGIKAAIVPTGRLNLTSDRDRAADRQRPSA
jgi:hypothetical protein